MSQEAADNLEIQRLLRQQTAIAQFGSFALRETELQIILNEAVRVCADGLSVTFCKICRYRPMEDDLFIQAGIGWRPGVVGTVISKADESSPQGRAFITGKPAICDDIAADKQFNLAPFYSEYGIVSTIDVVIKGDSRPYGVLEIDSDKPRHYDQHDIDFLTGFANVVAEAVAKSDRAAVLSAFLTQTQKLNEEKDVLLDQRKVLVQELEHRVRNNLQLIYGMLNQQLADTSDELSKRGIKAVARRVSTLASVYNNLIGDGTTSKSDLGVFARSLCTNIQEFQHSEARDITLSCDADKIVMGLDNVTVLGIIITELVTNAYDHAFPNDHGTITVTIHRDSKKPDTGSIVIADDGQGFDDKVETKRHGISLLKRLVQQIKGTVTVSTTHGTRWTVSFPITGEPA